MENRLFQSISFPNPGNCSRFLRLRDFSPLENVTPLPDTITKLIRAVPIFGVNIASFLRVSRAQGSTSERCAVQALAEEIIKRTSSYGKRADAREKRARERVREREGGENR